MKILISLLVLTIFICLSTSYQLTLPKVQVTNTNLGYRVNINTPNIAKIEEILEDGTVIGRYTYLGGNEETYSIRYIISKDGIRTAEEPVFKPPLADINDIQLVEQPFLLDERNRFLESDLDENTSELHPFLQQNPIQPVFLPIHEDPLLRALLFGKSFSEDEDNYITNARKNFFNINPDDEDSYIANSNRLDSYEREALANKYRQLINNNQYFTPDLTALQIPLSFLTATPDNYNEQEYVSTEKSTTEKVEDKITETTEESATMEDITTENVTDKESSSVSAEESETLPKVDEEGRVEYKPDNVEDDQDNLQEIDEELLSRRLRDVDSSKTTSGIDEDQQDLGVQEQFFANVKSVVPVINVPNVETINSGLMTVLPSEAVER